MHHTTIMQHGQQATQVMHQLGHSWGGEGGGDDQTCSEGDRQPSAFRCHKQHVCLTASVVLHVPLDTQCWLDHMLPGAAPVSPS